MYLRVKTVTSILHFTLFVLIASIVKVKRFWNEVVRKIIEKYESNLWFDIVKQFEESFGADFLRNWSQKVQSILFCFLKGRKAWSRCNNTRCFVHQTIQPLISAMPFLSMLDTCSWHVSHETNFCDSCPRFFKHRGLIESWNCRTLH